MQGGCAGLGGQTSLTRDAGRKDSATVPRSVFCVCAVVLPRVLYSRAATVWSCAHIAIVYLYIGIKTKGTFAKRFPFRGSNISAHRRFRELEIAPRSPTPREAALSRKRNVADAHGLACSLFLPACITLLRDVTSFVLINLRLTKTNRIWGSLRSSNH